MVRFKLISNKAEYLDDLIKEVGKVEACLFNMRMNIFNTSEINRKLLSSNTFVYSIVHQELLKGAAFFQFNESNKQQGYLDVIIFQDGIELTQIIKQFIDIMTNTFGVSSYLKEEEINDNRVDGFKSCGFKKIACLRQDKFLKGSYIDRDLYYYSI